MYIHFLNQHRILDFLDLFQGKHVRLLEGKFFLFPKTDFRNKHFKIKRKCLC
jgi:hypothetical protein